MNMDTLVLARGTHMHQSTVERWQDGGDSIGSGLTCKRVSSFWIGADGQ